MAGISDESELTSDWSELTHECLLNILTRLTFEDRWRRTMLVCKSWFQASTDSSLHSVLDLESSFKSRPSESSSWWIPEFERKIDNIIRSVVDWSDGGLVEIKVRHCSDRAISLIAQRYIYI